MRKIALVLCLFSSSLLANAADGEYAVSRIPQQLLKNAHIVIRKEVQRIELKSLDKMVIYNKYAITVFDEQGDEYANLVEVYDQFNTIDYMDGALYDATGKKIKNLKKADIKDESTGSDGDLAVDAHVKTHSFYHRVYPYTVEYESQVIKKQTMFFPSWNPVKYDHVAVEASLLEIIVPKDYELRYRNYNCPVPVVEDQADKKKYSWQVKDFAAVLREYAAPNWHEIAPYISLAPSEFQIEDYKGNMKDWQEYGKFVYALGKGRDVLPEAIKVKVHQLTDGVSSDEEKVSILYKYLQENTRYISIQLGIGGWRPFEASYVASKAYGDCKALSNYMVALLKEAKITGYYTLVRAGRGEADITPDFSSSQFNHVIVAVPMAKDTTWLECTSQTTPPGYMGGFTGNRHALMINEHGGKLVKTPRYRADENLQVRNIEAEIDAEGHLKAIVQTRYKAMQQDELHQLINGQSKEKLMEYLKSEIDLPNYDVQKFEYKEQKDKMPSINETLELKGNNYAAVTGKRLFISPNLLSKSHRKLLTDETRKYDVRLTYEYKDIDTVVIKFPKGYQPESVPKDIKIESRFGKYSCTTKLLEDRIIYYRNVEQFTGRFPAKDYNELVAYYEQIYKADRNKVVLVRNE
jgi:hypothetical protein